MRTRLRLPSSGPGTSLGCCGHGLWPTPAGRRAQAAASVQAGPEAPPLFWEPTQPSATRPHHGQQQAVCQGTVWQTRSALSPPSSGSPVLLRHRSPRGQAGPLGRPLERAAKGKGAMQGGLGAGSSGPSRGLQSLRTAATLLTASRGPADCVTGDAFPSCPGTKAWGGLAACGSPGDTQCRDITSAADGRVPQLSLR